MGYYIWHLRNLRLWILFLWPDTNSYRLFFLSNILSHTPLRTIKRWFVWKFPWNKSNAGHRQNLITCFCHQTLMVRYLFLRSVTTLALLNMTDPFQMKQIGYFRYSIYFSFSSWMMKIKKIKMITDHSNLNKGKIDRIVWE